MNYCQLYLTCPNSDEAKKIALALLEQKLAVCTKQIPVASDFLWEGSIEHNNEILLILTSREDLFQEIEAEVANLHSYDTFVLELAPVARVSKKAAAWMAENLKPPVK